MAAKPKASSSLFKDDRHPGVRVVVTGQVGLDKKPFLERVVEIGRKKGKEITLANVGDMMYAEAPDVVRGRILDLPRQRLNSLRRSVFKDILNIADRLENLIVNTHATFRWRHGLFPAFDFDQLSTLNADLFIALVDNVDAIHERLTRDHDLRHTLKDILVWREEEIVVTEVVSAALKGHSCTYVMARGLERDTAESIYRLMFEPQRKRIYPSFPMTHVMDLPDVLAEIDEFRWILHENFITFDPGDVDEKRLLMDAADAARRGDELLNINIHGRSMQLRVSDVTSIAGDIDGQIYARDFKLIDQSDMIVSYIPQLPSGKPGLSSGVERELQHAYEATKEVYVVWKPAAEPSPFITETATKVFSSVRDLLAHFKSKGYLSEYQLRLAGKSS